MAVHFVVINSSLVNAGTPSEDSQRVWLEDTLRAKAGKRVFLFSHYPPFIDRLDEPEHYDNYAEPGRSWLLELAAKNGVEAIFSGHVHHFFYNRYKGVKLYTFPATSFTRQDFAEVFPVDPAPEFGRDDEGKFMVCVVSIDEHGHRLRFVSTQGHESGPVAPVARIEPPSRKPLTPFLRHSWARAVDLPYQGPMEEFSRKRARNDYPVLRLWQMGIYSVRTPLSDLADRDIRARMRDWHATGISFSLFCSGSPSNSELELIASNAEMISALEIAVVDDVPPIPALLPDIPVRIGRVCSSADAPARGSRFAHTVSFGYRVCEIETVRSVVSPIAGLGVTFQITASEDLAAEGERIAAFSEECGRPVAICAKISLEDPSAFQSSEDWAMARVSDALDLANRHPNIEIMVDTFCAVDRGYHPRVGFIDRLSNLTAIGRMLNESTGTVGIVNAIPARSA